MQKKLNSNISEKERFLVGEAVKPKFKSPGEDFKWYDGKIVSHVPGFHEWYNIVYDEEPDTVYTFKWFEDLNSGDFVLKRS